MVADIINFLSNTLVITLIVGYFFAFWAALLIWTWFDISARTDNYFYRLGAVLMVATGALLGFVIYLLLRPGTTKEETDIRAIENAMVLSHAQVSACPSCYHSVKEGFSFCPNCAFKLHTLCGSCQREVFVSWASCPYCGTRITTSEAEPQTGEEKRVSVVTVRRPRLNFLRKMNPAPALGALFRSIASIRIKSPVLARNEFVANQAPKPAKAKKTAKVARRKAA
jgi:hypothetical protein